MKQRPDSGSVPGFRAWVSERPCRRGCSRPQQIRHAGDELGELDDFAASGQIVCAFGARLVLASPLLGIALLQRCHSGVDLAGGQHVFQDGVTPLIELAEMSLHSSCHLLPDWPRARPTWVPSDSG